MVLLLPPSEKQSVWIWGNKKEKVFVGVVNALGYGVLFLMPPVLLCTIHFKASIMRKEKEQRSGAVQQGI